MQTQRKSSPSNQREKFVQNFSLNTKNTIANKAQVENIINSVFDKINKRKYKCKRYNHARISNLDVYIKSFTHESYIAEQRHLQANPPENIDQIRADPRLNKLYNHCPKVSNERLEFLGDSRIDDVVVEYLYERFPDQREDFLTKLKIRLVKTEMLSFFAQKLGLDKFILMSSFQDSLERKTQGRNNPKILENCFEAFIGAIVEDFRLSGKRGLGYDLTYDFIVCLIELYVDLQELIMNNDNFKDSILRYFQSIKQPPPEFNQLFLMGKPNDRTFQMCMLIPRDSGSIKNKEIKNKLEKYHALSMKNIDSILVERQKSHHRIPFDDTIEHTEDCWKRGCERCQNAKIIENLQKFITFNDKYIIGMGKESSKKKTEQICSKYALVNLNVDLNF